MSQPLKPKIGIVSGIGPLAGSDVLAKVFKNAALIYGAVEDSEYPDVVLVNHGIYGVDNTGALSDVFEKEIVALVMQLEAQGANIIGIACNTAHTYIEKIKTAPKTVLINLIDAVASEAAKSHGQRLLLTSAASKQQKLYHGYLEKHGVKFAQTNLDQQALLDEAISLVMGHQLEAAGILLQQVLKSALDNGHHTIIAGCTELPIAIRHCSDTYGLKIIDSNDILSKGLLAYYYQQSLCEQKYD